MTSQQLQDCWDQATRLYSVQTFERAGTTWRYRVAGDGDSTLVVLPGALGSASSYFVESYDWRLEAPDAWRGPVTILLSRKDAMVGSKMRIELSALYPDAATHVFQSDGHGAYVYDPLGFSQTVASALESA